jgi:hypothetical protein
VQESGVLKMKEEPRGEYLSAMRETLFLPNGAVWRQHIGVLQVLKLVFVHFVSFLFSLFEKHSKMNYQSANQ